MSSQHETRCAMYHFAMLHTLTLCKTSETKTKNNNRRNNIISFVRKAPACGLIALTCAACREPYKEVPEELSRNKSSLVTYCPRNLLSPISFNTTRL
jgi:hypothetical protein